MEASSTRASFVLLEDIGDFGEHLVGCVLRVRLSPIEINCSVISLILLVY